jgi:GDP-D-mannose 3',5'-epimerase
MRCLVTGAGGFIGGYLVKRLLDDGHEVAGTDIKELADWWQLDHRGSAWGALDLRDPLNCRDVLDVEHVDRVFHLAADMGGMGFIERHKADCMLNVLADTNMLVAARDAGVGRFYFSSSACVYPQALQRGSGGSLTEPDAYVVGADPEDGYGWEKLFIERMCRHFFEDFGLETRVGRHHTVYGEHGSWRDGREKVPAALSRKVAECKLGLADHVEVWGDGRQVRSFLHVDDAVDGILRVMESDVHEPVNIGSERPVTVEDLLCCVEDIASARRFNRVYDPSQPQGVRARCSDSTLLKSLGWSENVTVGEGVRRTYRWVEEQVKTGLTTNA